jgi:CubicO group peptidase (beta-lactamase class C family)
MERTTVLQELPSRLLSDLASGYRYENGRYQFIPPEYYPNYPAGSISSTASDMTHFMIAHLQDGMYLNNRILEESTAQEMHQQSFTHLAELPGWAHGFIEREINGQRVIGHSGNLFGYSSYLGLAPELGLGLFIVCNSPEGNEAFDNLVCAFFDHYYPSTINAQPIPSEDLNTRASRFEGIYVPVRRLFHHG